MKATIDRIEGGLAILILKDDPGFLFNLPVDVLPACKEGDVIDITITRDPESTQATKERVSSLIEKLKKKSNQ